MKRFFASLTTAALLTTALPAQAFTFDPEYIISDAEFTDIFALDLNQIQQFLDRGYLADYKTEDWEGKERYAADIIWRAAQQNGISPKVILVLLQKEQSLIEDDDPTDSQLDWATGYAVCDDCSKDDPAIQRWKGFGKQVNSATLQFIEGYMADIDLYGTTQGTYGPDVPVSIDGETITPANAATASLYAYTPHFHGNENFAKIWHRWFATTYPTGSLLQAEGSDGVYLIEFGYKRPIRSQSALQSRFNADHIISVSQTTLDTYPEGRPIDFPNYSLLMDEDGTIYLLVDDTLRPIDSMETFRSIGFVMDEVTEISNDDLAYYEIGDTITMETAYPQGNLLELTTNGRVFYIEDGMRHLITDPAVLAAHFPGATPTPVTPTEVEQYQEASPLKMPDGYLVKTADDPTVYVISEGDRRAIPSESVFTAYGWAWSSIVTIEESTMNRHQIADDIDDPNAS